MQSCLCDNLCTSQSIALGELLKAFDVCVQTLLAQIRQHTCNTTICNVVNCSMCLRGCTATRVADDEEGACLLLLHLLCSYNSRSRHRHQFPSVVSYARRLSMVRHRSTLSSRRCQRRRANRLCARYDDANRSCIVDILTNSAKTAVTHFLYSLHVCCISGGRLTGCGLGVGQWPLVSAFTSISMF